MKAYVDLVSRILETGELKSNRTGVDTIAVPGAMIDHDMSQGFPLLTTKRVAFKQVACELEFFINGLTDKKWLQDRGVHIWDDWANPTKAPYGHSEEARAAMRAERDLGPIYGYQWRHFGAEYPGYDKVPVGGVDQLASVVETLKTNPHDRRMIVSAWNPMDKPQMALPPCHFCFEVIVINGKLSLLWSIRSVDVALGMPYNIASYALLLHLLAKESGLKEGRLVGFCGDTHIYVNHIDGLKEQIARRPYQLPVLDTPHWDGIFRWGYMDTTVVGYRSHPKIKYEIAV